MLEGVVPCLVQGCHRLIISHRIQPGGAPPSGICVPPLEQTLQVARRVLIHNACMDFVPLLLLLLLLLFFFGRQSVCETHIHGSEGEVWCSYSNTPHHPPCCLQLLQPSRKPSPSSRWATLRSLPMAFI